MKIAQRFLIFLVLCTTLWFSQSTVYAKVYASQLRVTNPDGSPFDGNFSDGSGARLSFILNDTATVAIIEIKDTQTGLSVAQITAQELSSGLNSVDWDGSGGEAGKSYIFEVTAEQPNASNTDWTVFYDSGRIFIFTRGCDVVRDMTSPLFGLIYVPNTGGDPPQEGKGIAIYNPDGSFHDPFLVVPDISDGGTVDWGGGADSMYGGVFDDEERFYVSAIDAKEVRRLNTDLSLTAVVQGLTNPKGLYMVGEGENRVLYICDDNKVVRAQIGTADTFTGTVEVVGVFSDGLPKNVAIDDDGAMYIALRKSNVLDSDAKGIKKFDISGNLPVTDNDMAWVINETVSLGVGDLLIDYGADRNTSTDDILYYTTRGGDDNPADGIWRVPDVNFPFPSPEQIISEIDLYDEDVNIQHRAAMGFDAAGNIILMENANEHVFFLSPPGEGATNSFTTTSAESITVDVAVSVESLSELHPRSFRLAANYPNPFNPSTTINYQIAKAGPASVKIYNLLGEEIRTIVNEFQTAGSHSVLWNGKDNSVKTVASGVYIVTLKSGDFIQSRRVTFLK